MTPLEHSLFQAMVLVLEKRRRQEGYREIGSMVAVVVVDVVAEVAVNDTVRDLDGASTLALSTIE